MYADVVVNDEEVSELVRITSSPTSPRRGAVPVICAMLFVASAFAGKSVWNNRGLQAETDAVVGLALSNSRIEIHMDILGVDCNELNAGDKNKFIAAVTGQISKKGDIPSSATKVDDTTFVCDHPTGATGLDKAARSEFLVTIDVPAELTGDALKARLRDEGNLKHLIEDEISAQVPDATHIVVQSAPMEVKTTKNTLLSVTDDHTPIIVLDIDVRGVYYSKLVAAGAELRQSFVTAVRQGIAATNDNLESNSIGLDISNGATNQKVPFVHVVAKIPVPATLSADAFMSAWHDGSDAIAEQVLKNVEGLGQLDLLRKSETGGIVHDVLVTTGALELGGLRESFATEITLEVSIHDLKHTGAAGEPSEAAIKKKVQEELASRSQVAVEDIEVTTKSDTAALLRMQVKISARGSKAGEKKISDWEGYLIPAARTLQKYFTSVYPDAEDTGVGKDYRVMVGISEVKSEVNTVDLDLVVHGVDLDSISGASREAFISDLAARVRQGIGEGENDKVKDQAKYEKIQVVVAAASGGTDHAINVRAKVPVSELNFLPQDVASLMSNLEKTEDMKAKIEEHVRQTEGIKLIATWTTDAVSVSMPGHIDDFDGDVVGKGDHL